MPDIPSWARIGSMVVFIGTGFPDQPGAEHLPSAVIGEIYTIDWIGMVSHQLCFGLKELGDDSAFDYRGFRPAHTIETDISEHFALLLVNKITEDA